MPITSFDKVELLLPMTGTNSGTTFTDYSIRQRTVTRVNTVTSTVRSAFSAYGSSGAFNGSNTYLDTDAGIIDINADYTIDGWIWLDSTSSTATNHRFTIATTWTTTTVSNSGYLFSVLTASSNYKLYIETRDSAGNYVGVAGSGNQVPRDEWVHVAVSRSGDVYRLFINGAVEATVTDSTAMKVSASGTRFGMYVLATTGSFYAKGNMNDVRLTQSALYTAAFTPPARMTQRTLTRANVSSNRDSHVYDRAVLFDWNAGGGVSKAVTPDSEGDFVADDLIDLEYGVAFIKDGCGPICRGPVEVDPDA